MPQGVSSKSVRDFVKNRGWYSVVHSEDEEVGGPKANDAQFRISDRNQCQRARDDAIPFLAGVFAVVACAHLGFATRPRPSVFLPFHPCMRHASNGIFFGAAHHKLNEDLYMCQ